MELENATRSSVLRRWIRKLGATAAPQVFADLPLVGKEFRELHWLGFTSLAAADAAFFIDDIRIKRIGGKAAAK